MAGRRTLFNANHANILCAVSTLSQFLCKRTLRDALDVKANQTNKAGKIHF